MLHGFGGPWLSGVKDPGAEKPLERPGMGGEAIFDMGSGGRTGERNRTHSDGGAWGRNGWLVMDITLAGFGKTGRNAALKVSDDVWRRMTVESRMSWRSVSGGK